MIDMEWIRRLEKLRFSLTKQEQAIVNYLEVNFHELSHLNAEDIASATMTSRPTVYRLCRKMGYVGFKEFKSAMNMFNKSLIPSAHPFDAMQLTPKIASNQAMQNVQSAFELFQKGFAVDIQALQKSAMMFSEQQVSKIVTMILLAEIIYCIGYETSYFPAKFLAERLSRLKKKVQFATGEVRSIKDMLFPICESDLLLVFEYHKNVTLDLELLSFAKKQGAKTVLLTNYPTSPAIIHADEMLFVPRGYVRFKHSIAVPMTIANNLLLAVEFALSERPRVQALQQWDEFNNSYASSNN